MLTLCVLTLFAVAAVVAHVRQRGLRLPRVPRPVVCLACVPLCVLAFLAGVLVGLALVVLTVPVFAVLSCFAPVLLVARF